MKKFSLDSLNYQEIEYQEDANGYIRVPIKVMKVGTLEYRTQNGGVKYANVSLDELKKAAKTFELTPLTKRHPVDMIGPKTGQSLKDSNPYGTSAENSRIENREDGQWLVVDGVLQDPEAIQQYRSAKESGQKMYVSAGYWRDEKVTGENMVDFQNINGNHIAIGVVVPRAKGASMDEDIFQKPKKKVKLVKQKLQKVELSGFSMDEATVEYADESAAVVERLVDREKQIVEHAHGLEQKLNEAKKSMDEKDGALDTLKEKVASLEKEVESRFSMDEFKAEQKALAEVKSAAVKLGINDEFESSEAGKKIVAEKYTGRSMDEKTVDYIQGVYETAVGDKIAADKIKSEKALKEAGKHQKSMDSKPVSQMSVEEVRAQMKGGKQ